jgi:hypothetical protein
MPEGRVKRGPQRGSRVGVPMRGRSGAKSMDGAEHSAMLKRVMSTVQREG